MGIDDCKTAWRACDRGRRRSAAVGTFDDLLSRYCRSPDCPDPGERTRVVDRGPASGGYGEIMVREVQPLRFRKRFPALMEIPM